MGEGNSIIRVGKVSVNVGELSRPATVFIEKVSAAIGEICKPHQIKEIAKAEAEAAIVHAETEIKITEIHRRAARRWIEEEAKKQENMEAIAAKALLQIEDKSKPEKMDDDWVSNFFDKCRIVSDEEMQELWAKVLAGEANAPGSYSKRTVNFVASLDKQDAILFTKLCAFGWIIANVVPLIYDVRNSIYDDAGINFNTLTHLDEIGLVTFDNLAGFQRVQLPKRIAVQYYDKPFLLEFQKDQENNLQIGSTLLTQTGQELARICGSMPVPDFVDYVLKHWAEKGYAIASPYPRAVAVSSSS